MHHCVMLKGTNYSLDEVNNLLELIDEILPLSATQWENIAKHHMLRSPNRECSMDSIKRKFKELHSKKICTGGPNSPQEDCRAKRIRREIIESMNSSDLNSRTEEEGSGSDDGDGESSQGSSQDYADIRDVIHPHGPLVNDEAEDVDLSVGLGDAAGSSDEPPNGGGEGEAVAKPVSSPLQSG